MVDVPTQVLPDCCILRYNALYYIASLSRIALHCIALLRLVQFCIVFQIMEGSLMQKIFLDSMVFISTEVKRYLFLGHL
jgi:hypothetical protein